jgi:hypothetical protein
VRTVVIALNAARTAGGRQGTPFGTVGDVKNVVRLVIVVSALAGGAALARRLLAERAPRRELNGSGPILGSLDTWPAVPRSPSGSGHPGN